MNAKTWILAAACISLFPAVSQARDTTHFLPFETVVQEALNAGRLDGSVKFYLAGNKKTNAFNKSDEAACSWALQSALIRFQNAAKAAGANAVVDLASNYKNVEYKDSQKYECHAGAIMAGVALKGNLANVK
ncbi:MAG: excinuclease [Pseudomonadales bacterium]